jgi:hypothetical protein
MRMDTLGEKDTALSYYQQGIRGGVCRVWGYTTRRVIYWGEGACEVEPSGG